MLAPKSALFTQLTRLHASKRGVFGKAVYQSLLIYVVYQIRSIESEQIYGVKIHSLYKSDLIFIVYHSQVNESAQIHAV